MIIFNLLESFKDVFERPVGVFGEVCPPIVVISVASIVERSIDDTTPTQCNGSGMPTFLVVERFALMRDFANLISHTRTDVHICILAYPFFKARILLGNALIRS
jgi:hypothetical protein